MNKSEFTIIESNPLPWMKRYKVYYYGSWHATCRDLDTAFQLVDEKYDFCKWD